jgi:hypothetical protein
MYTDALMPLPMFLGRNGLCKTNFYYLKRMGRAPETICLGSKVMISPEAEAAWRKQMAENPIKGSLRNHALAMEAA